MKQWFCIVSRNINEETSTTMICDDFIAANGLQKRQMNSDDEAKEYANNMPFDSKFYPVVYSLIFVFYSVLYFILYLWDFGIFSVLY